MMNVFISDYGCISPMGFSKMDLKNNLINENLCISRLPEDFLPPNLNAQFAGLIPNQFLDYKAKNFQESLMQQKSQWLKTLFESLEKSNDYDFDTVILIHNIGPNIISYYNFLDTGKVSYWGEMDYGTLTPLDFLKNGSFRKDVKIISLHNTCASVSAGIAYAAKRIKSGIGKKILLISFENSNHQPQTFISLNALGVLNTKANTPSAAITPFSAERNGFAKSDALGYLVIESNQSLRSKKPLCEIVGQSVTADSHSLTDGIEDGSLVAKTMNDCLLEAQITATSVDYINAHGTGTVLNDSIERKAILNLFSNCIENVMVSSIKSFFGHALCATGIVEIAATLEMFGSNFIAANLNYNPPPDEKLNIVKSTILNRRIKYCLKNSFGFGGYNASILMRNVS